MITMIVMEHFFVAITTVQVDHLEWTAVQMLVMKKIFYFEAMMPLYMC